eukprot:185830-Alexandrium_andersonii.AAC.1
MPTIGRQPVALAEGGANAIYTPCFVVRFVVANTARRLLRSEPDKRCGRPFNAARMRTTARNKRPSAGASV